jgi:hypothetical protein
LFYKLCMDDIWTIRNMICIEKSFPEKLVDTVYLGLSFIQKWKLLMKELDISKVEDLAKTVLGYAKHFKPLESYPSDVGFI